MKDGDLKENLMTTFKKQNLIMALLKEDGSLDIERIQELTHFTKEQREEYFDHLNVDFDHDLSFAISDADKELLGYALLKRESIETTILTKPSVEFENQQYGCRLVKIGTLQDHDNDIFMELAKKSLDRIEMWYDQDTDSTFDHLWGIFNNEPDAHLFADAVAGEKAECLIDSVKQYLVYKPLEPIDETEYAPGCVSSI